MPSQPRRSYQGDRRREPSLYTSECPHGSHTLTMVCKSCVDTLQQKKGQMDRKQFFYAQSTAKVISGQQKEGTEFVHIRVSTRFAHVHHCPSLGLARTAQTWRVLCVDTRTLIVEGGNRRKQLGLQTSECPHSWLMVM